MIFTDFRQMMQNRSYKTGIFTAFARRHNTEKTKYEGGKAMTEFLQAFLQVRKGGIFLFAVAVAALTGLYFWFKWKKVKNAFSGSVAPTPSRIHLVPDTEPDWVSEDAAEQAVSAFSSLGFTDVGAYKIKEMKSVKLFGLIHPPEQITAVVYRHEDVGVWSDVGIEYENGESLTVSNAPLGGEMDVRPNARKIIIKGLDEIQLLEKVMQERKRAPCKSVSAENFASEFERSYAEDMDWRNSRGTTKEEIRRVAENMDGDFSDNDIDAAYLQSLGNEIDRLNEECIQTFIETTDMRVSEWEKIRDRIFSVHEKIPPEMLLEYIENYIALSEAQSAQLESFIDPDKAVKEVFEAINESLPEDMKSKKIGEISKPVKADIYAFPNGFPEW